MKVIIPLAGLGKRMRPHTHTKAKPMVRLAGKPILGHLLDWLVNGEDVSEVILIISPHQTDVAEYARSASNKPVRIMVQEKPLGQAHAIAQAKAYVDEPVLICFSDTLSDVTFRHLKDFEGDALIYVKEVQTPERFGVVVLDEMSKNQIVDLAEKPSQWVSDLAMIGLYFFRDYEGLFSAIETVLSRPAKQGGEYFLADAIKEMLEQGKLLQPYIVKRWFDTGLPDYTLAAHRFLLEEGYYASPRPGVVINHPVYIADDATVSDSVIGPYVTIESDCTVRHSVLRDCVLDEGAKVYDAVVSTSLLGRRAVYEGQAMSINISDDSTSGPASDEDLPTL